ncbi:hypothetical protein Hamer_G008875 [Homarus americanus]|uniref:Uncharacterized protein n=1 Tax=Homarus americanus TaxID=6706 RepID=A0A8J5JL56_HOMAM|nr:hypothetical protein Hamer_G008875 [Homarus americanus]
MLILEKQTRKLPSEKLKKRLDYVPMVIL